MMARAHATLHWSTGEGSLHAKERRSPGQPSFKKGCPPPRTWPRRWRAWFTRQSKSIRGLIAVFVVLSAFAVLLVTWDVLLHRLFPEASTGWRHASLTAWASVITSITVGVVYLIMRRQQQRHAATAKRLGRLLESYRSNASAVGRFENPYLIHCRDLIDCTNPSCPMYDAPGERCWQVVGMGHPARPDHAPSVNIQQCHQCKVYRASCPDELTELGEGFNNLMFLLDEERERARCMRAQMVERQKMAVVGQLAAGIAHEIGNPLSSISSITQMLKRGGARVIPHEQIDLIDGHIHRISFVVRQLSLLSRPGTERWEELDLAEVLSESVRLISFDRRARNITIDYTRPTRELPKTYGLRAGLQQVFLYLALNGMDAMQDGGTLTIRIQVERGGIIVRFKDTGTGIRTDIRDRVFDPFFTTKEPGEGTGLGLAVGYSIVQKHGGTIDFSSTLGAGTEFRILLPQLDGPPENSGVGSEEHALSTKARG